jgi:hypothetical protein
VSTSSTAFEGFRWWLVRQRDNGLTDSTWVPTLCVDRRIVDALLIELRRAGVPARCTRLGASWHFPTNRSEWCLWVGNDAYWQAQERVAEVMPLLVRSLRGGTERA